MNNKEFYRRSCKNQLNIPLFSQAWWLDTVAKNNWEVLIIREGDELLASLPYVLKKKLWYKVISQPVLTQTLGPWIKKRFDKSSSQLAWEKKALEELFQQLPKHAIYQQNWHFTQTNWLPLYWQNYSQTTRYTYRIQNLKNLDAVWDHFKGSVRSDIKKAKNQYHLQVKNNLPIENFISLCQKTFQRQKTTLPYKQDLIKSIHQETQKKGCSRSFIAIDQDNQPHAGVYIIWDQNSSYYLMGGADPQLRNSGATSLCLWEAIQFASQVSDSFDFEGSMLKSVEPLFRAFGGAQTPYFSISKTNPLLLRTYRAVRKSLIT